MVFLGQQPQAGKSGSKDRIKDYKVGTKVHCSFSGIYLRDLNNRYKIDFTFNKICAAPIMLYICPDGDLFPRLVTPMTMLCRNKRSAAE